MSDRANYLMYELERQADAGDLAALCALVQVCDAGPAGIWVLEEFGAEDPGTVDWVLCQSWMSDGELCHASESVTEIQLCAAISRTRDAGRSRLASATFILFSMVRHSSYQVAWGSATTSVSDREPHNAPKGPPEMIDSPPRPWPSANSTHWNETLGSAGV